MGRGYYSEVRDIRSGITKENDRSVPLVVLDPIKEARPVESDHLVFSGCGTTVQKLCFYL